MDKRRLGRSGIEIAPIVFGGNVFGWTADEATSHALLDRFVAAGFNAIDTADVYSTWVPGHSGGESERILGSWLKARGGRDRVVVATKVGAEMGSGQKGLSRAWITEEVEESLRRLQTDYIDLYQSHRDDPATPIEEVMQTYARLIEQGKVRAIGASNFTAERLAESLAASKRLGLPRYESLQPVYNLYDRGTLEGPLEQLCRAEQIGVISYYGLAAGFLTGKYRSEADLGKSPRGGGVKKYLDARGLRILAALDEAAAAHDATPAQIAIAWLLAKPVVTAPIVSATSTAQLDELLDAASLKLDPPTIAKLDAAGG
jgi:aryl-alcohol dehydrogenase-like predicted oxidoreductase